MSGTAESTPLPRLLSRLEQHLVRVGAPVVGHLRPGADRQQIDAVLAERSVTASQEMHAWWGWHDGTDVGDLYGGAFVPLAENRLLATWHLPTLTGAAGHYDMLQRMWEGELPSPWWPVLLMSVSAELCSDTAGGGAVFLVDAHSGLPEDPPEPLATSLTGFVQLVLDLFDSGAVLPGSADSAGPSVDHGRLPRPSPFAEYW